MKGKVTMKLRAILIVFILLTLVQVSNAQNYPHVSIRDIQFVPQDSLIAGKDGSPYIGDTIQVTGIVIVSSIVDPTFDRRPIMYAGTRWQTYLQDTSGTEFIGLNIIQNDTSGVNQNSLMDLIDTAQIVTIVGVVEEYGGKQTQLNVRAIYPVQFSGQLPERPAPKEITIAEMNTGAAPNPTNIMSSGEKYEGQYVILRNVISSNRNTSTGTFYINDGLGNSMYVHDQSGYFTKRTHKLRDFEPPLDGSTIAYIRGVVGHNYNPNHYTIRPIYPDDMFITDSPPAISNIKRNTSLIAPNQAVTISANVIEYNQGDSVVYAKVMYRVNGGPLTEINMNKGANNLYSGTIPGVSLDSALVDFYIKSQDATGLVSYNPIDTARGKYFYLVLNRPLRVQDVQYSPFGSGYSAYNNYRVTVSGTVTADTSDLQGDGNQVGRRVYIQNGTGPWSGIWVFGVNADALKRGDNVTITNGLVTENNNNTRIDSIQQIIENSVNNPLPPAELILTSTIATSSIVPAGSVQAEQWEGVLVKYEGVVVSNENADGNPGPNGGGNSNFGEIVVKDASNVDTRVELQEGNHVYHNQWIAGLDTVTGNIRVKATDTFTQMHGVLFYSFGNYKLVPRKNDDFVGYVADANEQDVPEITSYNLDQNYPNPFNPTTTISYSIPKAGFVEIKVFNILGQEVKSLVNLEQTPGNYKVIFDGRDMTSGVYLYQISIGNFVQTKKMILMK